MSDNVPDSPEQIRAQIKALKELKGVLPEAQLNALLFEKLEQLTRYQAKLSGQGAIAQGEGSIAVTAVQGGTAIGRVEGNVYIGPSTSDPTLALRYYRQVIANLSCHIPLRSLDRAASDATTRQAPLSLASIYIDLETTTRVTEKPAGEPQRRQTQADETHPLRALEAVAGQRRLVLLGEPGSGKSTFVNHLAYCLAVHALAPEAGWLEHLPGWPEAEARLLPLKITLRDFARRYAHPTPHRPEPKHLWEFIQTWLADKNLAFAAGPLEQELQQGRALILLDGLDEVPSAAQRRFVRDAVQVFMERYPASRYLMTCRTLAYQWGRDITTTNDGRNELIWL